MVQNLCHFQPQLLRFYLTESNSYKILTNPLITTFVKITFYKINTPFSWRVSMEIWTPYFYVNVGVNQCQTILNFKPSSEGSGSNKSYRIYFILFPAATVYTLVSYTVTDGLTCWPLLATMSPYLQRPLRTTTTCAS